MGCIEWKQKELEVKNTELIRDIYIIAHSDDAEAKFLADRAGSASGCRGDELRKVHFEIGQRIGEEIVEKTDLTPSDTVLVSLLTGAIPFSLGIGSVIDTKLLWCDPHQADGLPAVDRKNIILIDEVINSGKTILEIAQYYRNEGHKIYLAATVMPEDSEAFDSDYDLFTFRVSEHRYIGAIVKEIRGAKGPDTAARLYSLM